MELVLLIGVQATGKSSFFFERFRNTHLRLNLDMLKTRNREEILLSACLASKTKFVVDNTNPTAADRARYIGPAKAAGFSVAGYFFESKIADVMRRNSERVDAERIPEKGILGTYGRLEIPTRSEGFDVLHFVKIGPNGFEVEGWRDEV